MLFIPVTPSRGGGGRSLSVPEPDVLLSLLLNASNISVPFVPRNYFRTSRKGRRGRTNFSRIHGKKNLLHKLNSWKLLFFHLPPPEGFLLCDSPICILRDPRQPKGSMPQDLYDFLILRFPFHEVSLPFRRPPRTCPFHLLLYYFY